MFPYSGLNYNVKNIHISTFFFYFGLLIIGYLNYSNKVEGVESAVRAQAYKLISCELRIFFRFIRYSSNTTRLKL